MSWRYAAGGDEIYVLEEDDIVAVVRPAMPDPNRWKWSVTHRDGTHLAGDVADIDSAIERADAARAQLSTAHGRLAARGRR
jgi:hypothetical protein